MADFKGEYRNRRLNRCLGSTYRGCSDAGTRPIREEFRRPCETGMRKGLPWFRLAQRRPGACPPSAGPLGNPSDPSARVNGLNAHKHMKRMLKKRNGPCRLGRHDGPALRRGSREEEGGCCKSIGEYCEPKRLGFISLTGIVYAIFRALS